MFRNYLRFLCVFSVVIDEIARTYCSKHNALTLIKITIFFLKSTFLNSSPYRVSLWRAASIDRSSTMRSNALWRRWHGCQSSGKIAVFFDSRYFLHFTHRSLNLVVSIAANDQARVFWQEYAENPTPALKYLEILVSYLSWKSRSLDFQFLVGEQGKFRAHVGNDHLKFSKSRLPRIQE